jgi:hypothetical protein
MIATIKCVVRQLLSERRGTNRNNQEYHRMDFLVEGGGGPHSKPYSVVATFYSNDGPIDHYPRIGQSITLTVSVTAHRFGDKWYNEVRAVGYESEEEQKSAGNTPLPYDAYL